MSPSVLSVKVFRSNKIPETLTIVSMGQVSRNERHRPNKRLIGFIMAQRALRKITNNRSNNENYEGNHGMDRDRKSGRSRPPGKLLEKVNPRLRVTVQRKSFIKLGLSMQFANAETDDDPRCSLLRIFYFFIFSSNPRVFIFIDDSHFCCFHYKCCTLLLDHTFSDWGSFMRR